LLVSIQHNTPFFIGPMHSMLLLGKNRTYLELYFAILYIVKKKIKTNKNKNYGKGFYQSEARKAHFPH